MANARRMLNECNESLTKKEKMQCRIIEGAKGGRGRDNDKIKSLRDKKGEQAPLGRGYKGQDSPNT